MSVQILKSWISGFISKDDFKFGATYSTPNRIQLINIKDPERESPIYPGQYAIVSDSEVFVDALFSEESIALYEFSNESKFADGKGMLILLQEFSIDIVDNNPIHNRKIGKLTTNQTGTSTKKNGKTILNIKKFISLGAENIGIFSFSSIKPLNTDNTIPELLNSRDRHSDYLFFYEIEELAENNTPFFNLLKEPIIDLLNEDELLGIYYKKNLWYQAKDLFVECNRRGSLNDTTFANQSNVKELNKLMMYPNDVNTLCSYNSIVSSLITPSTGQDSFFGFMKNFMEKEEKNCEGRSINTRVNEVENPGNDKSCLNYTGNHTYNSLNENRKKFDEDKIEISKEVIDSDLWIEDISDWIDNNYEEEIVVSDPNTNVSSESTLKGYPLVSALEEVDDNKVQNHEFDKECLGESQNITVKDAEEDKRNKFEDELAHTYQTDLTRWRLVVDEGRHFWKYIDNDVEASHNPQSLLEKYWIGLPYNDLTENLKPPENAMQSAINGFEFFKKLQTDDGHWAGAYDGPMFITCGIVISNYICGRSFTKQQSSEMIRYLLNRANPVDGGWGLHFEGKTTVFGTGMNYTTLRILGVDPDNEAMVKARNTLHNLGSATAIPSWGKFWLSALGVYEWEGLMPLPPEPWLLPEFVPIFPGNWWVHTRAVYLGMCHIYALRKSMPLNNLTQSLRKELYTQDYDSINWKAQQQNVSEADRYIPNSVTLKLFCFANNLYERFHLKSLRKKALEETLLQIHLELENTNYLCIAPVNYAVNMLVMYYEHGTESKWFKGMVDRLPDCMWLCREGLAGTGTNGSQLWDTALLAQACVYTGLAQMDENKESMQKTLDFLAVSQIKQNPRDYGRCYRQTTLGAWPFSTRDQGYTVSDTTSEGLKAALMLQQLNFTKPMIEEKMFCNTVDVLLSMQNQDGGFASYEKVRGPKWLESINASEVFGRIMTEYTYPECTTSVVLGLTMFQKVYPNYRSEEIKNTIEKAVQFILNIQRDDGSWYGSWGICFTYAAMFAMNSLSSVGLNYGNCENVVKGCNFLLAHQNEDGGWGESYSSCEIGIYSPHPDGSQVVNTSFSVLALMAAKCPDKEAIKRGIDLIMSRQQPNGEWLQEGIEGVFNKNCMIAYPNYKFIFCIWALGQYSKIYE
ncbi:hypothetical protein BB558_001568 [Smittium angustum]|uniref:lanosterol synthase n=1 Tax=Smittium angustum TaxID=133377 RepID=A0A2U1JB83_SMIAN|nr:hypothetical protein BB558_001568 [Smittium angustum]